MTRESHVVERPSSQGTDENQPGLLPAQNVKLWRIGSLTYTRGGLAALFGWLLWGDFAWSIKERAVMPVFQLLLTEYGASNTLIAFLSIILPSAIGMFLGPIVSFRSDRYRSRMGRRIPFMLITTPIAAAAMAAIAFAPMLGEATHNALGLRSLGHYQSVLLYFGFFWVIFEIATITANSVFGAFLNDVVPQTLLGRFFGLFRAVSLIAGIIFNFWLLKKAEEHYVWLFVSIALLYAIGFTAMCLKVKEGVYPPPPEVPEHIRTQGRLARFISATKIYFKECYSKPYYRWVFFAIIMSNMCALPVNLYSVAYAQKLNLGMELYGKYLALTYVVSLVLAYPLGALADRIHPLILGMIVLFLYMICCVWGGLAATSTTPFAIAFVGHGVLSGTFGTTTASLPQRLYPHEKFAQFASACGVIASIMNIAASFILGRFLDYTGSTYRYTFTAGAILSVVSIVLLYVVYRRFKEYGGPRHYLPPE